MNTSSVDPWTKRKIREFIVSTFEMVCLATVILPTALFLVAAALSDNPPRASLFAVAVFLVSAFLAGGGLTLVSIAENTREAVRLLHQIEDTELRSIATDVQRLENAERDRRNEAAISAATLLPQLEQAQ